MFMQESACLRNTIKTIEVCIISTTEFHTLKLTLLRFIEIGIRKLQSLCCFAFRIWILETYICGLLISENILKIKKATPVIGLFVATQAEFHISDEIIFQRLFTPNRIS